MFDLGALTTYLQLVVSDGLYATGVGDAPKEGGWTGGTPGEGTYKPYLVLMHAGSSPLFEDTLGGGTEMDWMVNFTIRASAASYKQLTALGSKWRGHIDTWVKPGERFGTPPWQVANVKWNSLGPAEPNRSTSPATWRQQDSVGIIVTKP